MIVDATAEFGEVIWKPDAQFASQTAVARFGRAMHEAGVVQDTSYRSLWRWSVEDPEAFWPAFVDFAGIELGGTPGATLEGDSMMTSRWFPGRSLNAARQMLDGHEGVGLIRVSEDGGRREVTWHELRRAVGAFAASLRRWGVRPGDRVVAILPNVEEAVIAFLAVASIGAVWSVCAPEFGSGAIVSRFAQLEPVVLIAVPGYRLGGRDRERADEVTQIIHQLPSLRQVVWVTAHTESSVPDVDGGTLGSSTWDRAVAQPAPLDIVDVEFSHPLWVLFSSGTTGKPKGIVHGHGGALVELVKLHLIHSDLRPGDRYLNVASTSWVLWNSLVAALAVGATAVLLDGNPVYPTLDRVWDVVGRERVAAMGVGAGFVHACQKEELRPGSAHDLSALRTVQVTGSPLSVDGQRWMYRAIGDVWVNSMSGGTDIGSIFVGGVATLEVRLGLIQAPALGVDVQAWDESGHSVSGQRGELVVCQPMPSMPLRFWGDTDGSRYRSAYFEVFPGVWRHGDFIEISDAGILIHGRSDSTLNRHGLRLGSADIYSAVEAVPGVREALVVGAEMGTDYYMPLFLALDPDADPSAVTAAVHTAIRTELSPRYLPDETIIMRAIPHTRTGKKLEVPVKRLLQGASLEDVADLGAVDDAELLGEYAQFARNRQGVQKPVTA